MPQPIGHEASALLVALVKSGDAEGVRELLGSAKPAVAAREASGRVGMGTVLHLAARLGDAPTLEALVDHGSALYARGGCDQTPLHTAAVYGRDECCRVLLDRGAQVADVNRDGQTPLHMAVGHGHVGAAALLLDRGAPLELACTASSETPLVCAAQRRQCEACALLLDRGARIESRNANGRTALELAVVGGNAPLARLLLDRGADHRRASRPHSDTNLLHMACWRGHLGVAAVLLGTPHFRGKTRINRLSARGRTALHMAAFCDGYRSADLFACLVGHGADVNAPDRDGKTPLYHAVAGGKKGVVEGLLLAGARVTPADVQPLAGASMTDESKAAVAALLARWRDGTHPSQQAHAEMYTVLEPHLYQDVCSVVGDYLLTAPRAWYAARRKQAERSGGEVSAKEGRAAWRTITDVGGALGRI